jgi:hypothetical protein
MLRNMDSPPVFYSESPVSDMVFGYFWLKFFLGFLGPFRHMPGQCLKLLQDRFRSQPFHTTYTVWAINSVVESIRKWINKFFIVPMDWPYFLLQFSAVVPIHWKEVLFSLWVGINNLFMTVVEFIFIHVFIIIVQGKAGILRSRLPKNEDYWSTEIASLLWQFYSLFLLTKDSYQIFHSRLSRWWLNSIAVLDMVACSSVEIYWRFVRNIQPVSSGSKSKPRKQEEKCFLLVCCSLSLLFNSEEGGSNLLRNMSILYHVEQLLCNDSEIGEYTRDLSW